MLLCLLLSLTVQLTNTQCTTVKAHKRNVWYLFPAANDTGKFDAHAWRRAGVSQVLCFKSVI
jgi:hypothetical protein